MLPVSALGVFSLRYPFCIIKFSNNNYYFELIPLYFFDFLQESMQFTSNKSTQKVKVTMNLITLLCSLKAFCGIISPIIKLNTTTDFNKIRQTRFPFSWKKKSIIEVVGLWISSPFEIEIEIEHKSSILISSLSKQWIRLRFCRDLMMFQYESMTKNLKESSNSSNSSNSANRTTIAIFENTKAKAIHHLYSHRNLQRWRTLHSMDQ